MSLDGGSEGCDLSSEIIHLDDQVVALVLFEVAQPSTEEQLRFHLGQRSTSDIQESDIFS